MFVKEAAEKNSPGQVVIGYDLSDDYAQISYCTLGNRTPETISTITGEEVFNIPAALWMNLAGNQWYYGKEARKRKEDDTGLYLDRLLSRAYDGEEVKLDGKPFGAVALLTLFIKRSISLLTSVTRMEAVTGFLFTVDKVDERMTEILQEASQALHLKGVSFFFQSRAESFFAYNLYQPTELWNHQVLLCDLSGESLQLMRLYSNQKARPQVSFVETTRYPEFTVTERMEEMDGAFLEILKEACRERIVSAVYLIGEGFSQDWYKQSLRFLCQGRRVFLGNNLYSKGACYACLEKISPSREGQEHVFLGEDKLKANIGMKAVRKGEESYFAILNAGETWYQVKREFDFLLEEDNRFSLLVAPLAGSAMKEVVVTLTDLPKRPARTSRIRMQIFLTAVDRIHLTIEDLGFGEFFPASHRVWQEEFSLDEL